MFKVYELFEDSNEKYVSFPFTRELSSKEVVNSVPLFRQLLLGQYGHIFIYFLNDKDNMGKLMQIREEGVGEEVHNF